MDDPDTRKSPRGKFQKNSLQLTCYDLKHHYCPNFVKKHNLFFCSFCSNLESDLPLMSTKKKAKNTGSKPSAKYSCIRFGSKYHNLWEIKVVYQPGESDVCTTRSERGDLLLSGVENTEPGLRLQVGDSERRIVSKKQDQNRRYKTNYKRKERDIDKDKEVKRSKIAVATSNVLATKLVGDIETERARFEDEKRVLVEQMVRERAQKDAEYEELMMKLAVSEKNFETAKRQNRREKERVNKLVGGTLVQNVQGLLDQSMKRSSSKRKTGTLLSAIKEGDMYGDLGVSALDDMFVEIGREKFSAWKILREVDMDGGGFN